MAPRAAVLMCHAPIVIPPIGGDRGGDCVATTKAMEVAARVVVDAKVETVLVVSPHTPRHREAFGFVVGETLQGDFHTFGIRGLESTFRADAAAAATVARHAERAGLAIEPANLRSMDHGAMVPLWFLQQAGFKGRIALFGFPWNGEPGDSRKFGAAMATAMDSLERSWALIASGDMSHALKQSAPAGFHPKAHLFDETVVACVKEGRLGDVASIDPNLRNLAAEDVVESLEVADGALASDRTGLNFLSYEGPFGVGYLVAILRCEPEPGS
jgi:MEMO1 family protein